MVQGENIIKKMTIEVETSTFSNAVFFKDHLDVFIREEIYPNLELLLEKLQIEMSNDTFRFEHIPLEINISNNASMKDIKHSILSKLEDTFKKKNIQHSTYKNTSTNTTGNALNGFIFFLENGRYPWWHATEKTHASKFHNSIISSTNFVSKLASILPNIQAQKRLIYELDDKAIIKLISALQKPKKQHQYIYENLNIAKEIRVRFWELIFEQINRKNGPSHIQKLEMLVRNILGKSNSSTKSFKAPLRVFKNEILPLINLSNNLCATSVTIKYSTNKGVVFKLSNGNSTDQINAQNQDTIKAIKKAQLTFNTSNKIIKRSEENAPLKSSQEVVALEEGILVQNAGLALLHPFLKQLFKNLGFLSEDQKLQQKRVPEALAILYFLATKQETPHEHELLCEKFICDIPFEHAVSPIQTLTEKQKNACDEMLSAALSHWPALKTTNIDVLRSEFLMREGKITANTENEKLFVQRKTQDILLEKLPWNLSLLKFPWKKNMVFLEW